MINGQPLSILSACFTKLKPSEKTMLIKIISWLLHKINVTSMTIIFKLYFPNPINLIIRI